MWLRSLFDHLCWSVTRHDVPATRPTLYRAPSWSWASIDGPVTFGDSSAIKGSNLFQIINATTTLSGNDLLGQVSDGSLCVRAKLSHQLWKRKSTLAIQCSYVYPLREDSPDYFREANVSFSNASLVLDVPGVENELEIWSMPIQDQFALALQPTEGKDSTFTRIGAIVWRSSRDDLFSEELRDITII